MPSVRIWEGDLTKLVLERYTEKAFKVEPVKMTLVVEVKEIVEVVMKDMYLGAYLNNAASEAMKKIAESAAKVLKVKSDKAFSKWQADTDYKDFELEMKEFLKEYMELADEAPKQVQEATKKVWDEFTKTNKEYAKYKWKMVGKVGLCVVGVGTAVAVASTAGLGNIPGLVAGTLGAAKSLSMALQTAVKVAKSAETVGAELRGDVDDLVVSYKDMSKTAVTAQEIAAKAIDAFTTKSLTSIKSCENNLGIYRGKLAGLKKETHEISQKLDKLLDGNERIMKEIKAIKAKGVQSTLEPLLAKAETKANGMIETIIELGERVKKGKQAADGTEKLIAELKKKVNDKVYDAASVAIDISVLALEVWGGFGGGGSDSAAKFLEDPAEKAEVVSIGLNALREAAQDIEERMKG